MTEHVKKTSELIKLQQLTDTELRHRCATIFENHKAMAFAGRDDQLFTEKWTPDTAAEPYQFDRYEIKGDQVALYGIWSAGCFINTISISFPARLIDSDVAIAQFLRQQCDRNRAKREQKIAQAKAHQFVTSD
jgi:hypothetical protein